MLHTISRYNYARYDVPVQRHVFNAQHPITHTTYGRTEAARTAMRNCFAEQSVPLAGEPDWVNDFFGHPLVQSSGPCS